MPESGSYAPATPLQWLSDNPSIRESVLASVDLGGKALPDALATNPALFVSLVKATVAEAVWRDAPEGVVESLLVPVRRMVRQVARLDEWAHVTATLREAEGLRDRSELEPVLQRGIATAPDEANRAKLEVMLETLRRTTDEAALRVAADEVFLGPDDGTLTEFSPGQCLTCCGFGCFMCGIEFPPACPLCCIIGCLVCG